MGEELGRLLDLDVGDPEGDDLVGVRSEQQELVLFVLLLLALLKGRHEAMPGFGVLLDFWILDLEQERSLPNLLVKLLCHPIAGPPDLDCKAQPQLISLQDWFVAL